MNNGRANWVEIKQTPLALRLNPLLRFQTV